jgi:hypothetical protein
MAEMQVNLRRSLFLQEQDDVNKVTSDFLREHRITQETHSDDRIERIINVISTALSKSSEESKNTKAPNTS